MLIGELAQAVELPIDTIRFYEKRGLLLAGLHFVRKENNYREYTRAAADRLLLIKEAQAAGFTLREMRRSIGEWESDTLTTQQKREIFQGKIKEIEAKMAELERMKEYQEYLLSKLEGL